MKKIPIIRQVLGALLLISFGVGLVFTSLAYGATVTYSSTFNLRVNSSIVSKHATLAEALSAAETRGPGTYTITQPTATVVVAPPPCTYTYSAWGPCTAGQQKRTVASWQPPNCTASALILEQACTPCTYSAWGACVSGQQTRTKTPLNCVGTDPLTQSCNVPVRSVTTLDATSITKTGAVLNMSVVPVGSSATVGFEYGMTTTYGSSGVSGTISAGTVSVAANLTITGLRCGTLYHFRSGGYFGTTPVLGSDKTFTTLPCDPPQPPPPVTLRDCGTLTFEACCKALSKEACLAMPILTVHYATTYTPNGVYTKICECYGKS